MLRLSLQSGKRYQPQNAVYFLCVNWSHSKVIKKRVAQHIATSTPFDTTALRNESMEFGSKYSDKMISKLERQNICIEKMNTCKWFLFLVAVRIYYKPIDKFACKIYTTRYTVIESVNTHWCKVKLPLVQSVAAKMLQKKNLCLYLGSFFLLLLLLLLVLSSLPLVRCLQRL